MALPMALALGRLAVLAMLAELAIVALRLVRELMTVRRLIRVPTRALLERDACACELGLALRMTRSEHA